MLYTVKDWTEYYRRKSAALTISAADKRKSKCAEVPSPLRSKKGERETREG